MPCSCRRRRQRPAGAPASADATASASASADASSDGSDDSQPPPLVDHTEDELVVLKDGNGNPAVTELSSSSDSDEGQIAEWETLLAGLRSAPSEPPPGLREADHARSASSSQTDLAQAAALRQLSDRSARAP